MKVMTNYKFYDNDVEKVLHSVEVGMHKEVREIVFKQKDHGSLLINKEDVIALAKEFGLIVYEYDGHL